MVGSHNIWQGGTWYDVKKIGIGGGYSSNEFASTGDIGIMQVNLKIQIQNNRRAMNKLKFFVCR